MNSLYSFQNAAVFAALFIVSVSSIAQKQVIVHSYDEYDQLKAQGYIPIMENANASDILFQPKIWNGSELIEPEIKTLRGSSENDCACLKQVDKSYSIAPFTNGIAPEYRNDDGSTDQIALPFTFCLYGTSYTSCYINNNGNVSFGSPYGTFSASGFPVADFVMVAPFWADVDTRPLDGGLVYYKMTEHYMIVIWDHVGYFNEQTDKLNTFQLIISDGTDPIIPNGNNISFCYGDMEWTTGSASGGIDGFAGTPATVGANLGDGVSFMQAGRFDHAGSDYDGPVGNTDGVSWLDNQIMPINSCDAKSGNLIPITPVLTLCDTVYICADNSIDLQFLGPEVGQTISITYEVSDPNSGLIFTVITNPGASQLNIEAPLGIAAGTYDITITASDNGTPSQTVTQYLTLVIIASAPPIEITGTLSICSGQSAYLSIASGYTNIQWSNGSAATSIAVIQPGTYTVTANLGGCSTSGSAVVESFPAPVPTISGEPLICPNETTVLSVDQVYPGYTWSNGFNTNTVNVSAGNYTVTVIDDNGCTGNNSFTVSAYPSLQLMNDQLICDLQTSALSGNDLAGEWSYTTNLGTGTATIANASSTDSPVQVSAYGVYTFTYTDSQCQLSDSVQLSFLPSPNFYTPADSNACLGATIDIIPQGNFQEFYQWSWSSDNSTGSSFEYYLSPNAIDSTITWTASNACGTDQGNIRILGALCDILIPNVFTPNGDGDNDYFVVEGLENFPKSSLKVFNRWGTIVYENDNYRNNWSPRDMAEGTYFFILGVRSSASKTDYYEGHLTLLR